MSKPNRAKMCNWVANELRQIKTVPSNPADIQALAQNARLNDRKIQRLYFIVDEMGWNVQSSIEVAQALIEEYNDEFAPAPVVPV